MKYVSTRGMAPALAFDDVLLVGLARDGGLYVPRTWPRLGKDDIRSFGGLSYAELATRIMLPFVKGSISEADLAAIVGESYGGFAHPDVAPIKELGAGEWLLELFHGPTCAFKDYSLQVVGRLFDFVLKQRSKRVTIIGATSGDTGSAAIEACRDRDAIEIFILHPKGRISEVQRRQMTTVTSANVHNIAIEGTFDDCQELVKAMFNDLPFRERCHLAAVNSINWARIMAQIAYYFWAAAAIGAAGRPIAFAVPTGNFGNIFAGYAASLMGLPVRQLIIGSNRNDILTRFLGSGRMETTQVMPTLSPSMDIQTSSNFERLLFELHDRDGTKVAALMERFGETGAFSIDADRLRSIRALFDGERFDDEQTKQTIKAVCLESGLILDPHSAVGVAAGWAKRRDAGAPMVVLATAHPAKFPKAVKEATGVAPELPPRLADLLERQERYSVMPKDLQEVQTFVLETLREKKAA